MKIQWSMRLDILIFKAFESNTDGCSVNNTSFPASNKCNCQMVFREKLPVIESLSRTGFVKLFVLFCLVILRTYCVMSFCYSVKEKIPSIFGRYLHPIRIILRPRVKAPMFS